MNSEEKIHPFAFATVEISTNYIDSFSHTASFVDYFSSFLAFYCFEAEILTFKKPLLFRASWASITLIEAHLKVRYYASTNCAAFESLKVPAKDISASRVFTTYKNPLNKYRKKSANDFERVTEVSIKQTRKENCFVHEGKESDDNLDYLESELENSLQSQNGKSVSDLLGKPLVYLQQSNVSSFEMANYYKKKSLDVQEYDNPVNQNVLLSRKSISPNPQLYCQPKVKEKQEVLSQKKQSESCDLVNEGENRGKNPSQTKRHEGRMHSKTKKVLACDLCNNTFRFLSSLKRHLQQHFPAKNICDTCGKLFITLKSFKQHLLIHTNNYVQTSFQCKQCEKTFSTKYVLKYHIKTEHLGIRYFFQCQLCGKSFTQKGSYKAHAKAHLALKPHVCDICHQGFVNKRSLKEHTFLHSDTKSFICSVCNAAFKQSYGLSSHMRVHNETKGYVCSHCSKRFRQKQSLLRHERLHTGEKPFECLICIKNFSDTSVLRRHMMKVHKHKSDDWRKDTVWQVKTESDKRVQVVSKPEEVDRLKHVEKRMVQKCVPSNNVTTTYSYVRSVLDETSSIGDGNSHSFHHSQINPPPHGLHEDLEDQISMNSDIPVSPFKPVSPSSCQDNIFRPDKIKIRNYVLGKDKIETKLKTSLPQISSFVSSSSKEQKYVTILPHTK